MEEEIRRIAQENVSNRRKGMIAMIAMLITSFIFFAICAETNFQNNYSIFGLVATVIIGFTLIRHYDQKIIGKKTAVDIEVERLKSLHPEKKLELPKIDDAEMKLREMVRKSNRDDMV